MKQLVFAMMIVITSCNYQKAQEAKIKNNQELIKMVLKDQEIRLKNSEDFAPIDEEHRIKLMEMIANGDIKTNKDKLNAALILQHTSLTYCNDQLTSSSNENYLLAYMFAKNAFVNGDKEAGYYVAITYDRFLLYTKGYQKYGTQRIFDENEKEVWAPIDSTTSDMERSIYNVPSLEELLKQFPEKSLIESSKN